MTACGEGSLAPAGEAAASAALIGCTGELSARACSLEDEADDGESIAKGVWIGRGEGAGVLFFDGARLEFALPRANAVGKIGTAFARFMKSRLECC